MSLRRTDMTELMREVFIWIGQGTLTGGPRGPRDASQWWPSIDALKRRGLVEQANVGITLTADGRELYEKMTSE